MTETTPSTPQCVVCKTDHNKVPLITLTYQDTNFWICPQHLPMLIHSPQKLVGVLPGVENLEASDHDD